jgi:hypothetical protein
MTPLLPINGTQIAVFVRPFVPDGHFVFLEVTDVGIATQEPEQLIDDGAEMQFPNTEYVPVPVRSDLNFPCSSTSRSKSRY